MDSTIAFNMKQSLPQLPKSGKAKKCQPLFTADEALEDLDNSHGEHELNACYLDSELESISTRLFQACILVERAGLPAAPW